ncbi:hypothetical protein HX870_02160 [Pseudomonas gingeri]|uniref:hypothetical protein n=1 Tax=Pseudomonas gingeri TaxID=117681 RepID=UPI0015A3FDC7|nr:hypothetical protein [Pseudomonas gingeri]NWD66425.1 hypothetical protein [Pseudomonas gingeri]
MTKRARLYITNLTDSHLNLWVEKSTESGFAQHNPSEWLKNGYLAARSSLGDYVEMENGGPSPFTLKVDLQDGTTFHCVLDLWQSRDVGRKKLTTVPARPDLDVWQTSGGDIGDSSHGTLGIYIGQSKRPSLSKWMEALLAKRPWVTLNDVVMPGSHDAGMCKTESSGSLGGGGSSAETQRLSIVEQLNAGSRYFDLRVHRRANGDYHFGHFSNDSNSLGAFGERVEVVLDGIKSFLQTNAKECVILKWSHTGDLINMNSLLAVIKNRLGNAFYQAPNPGGVLARKRLADFAGHALCVFDTDFAGQLQADPKLYAYHDVADGATRGDANQTASKAAGLTVYDRYANNVDAGVVVTDQQHKLVTNGGQGNSFLFVLSWFATGAVGNTLDIQALAHTLHPRLAQFLQKCKGGLRPNVVYLDFIEQDLCSLIIELNDAPELNESKTYTLEPASHPGKALDTYSGALHPAAFLEDKAKGTSGMQWHLTLNPDNGSYYLRNNYQPDKVLTAVQGGLELWPLDPSQETQMWKIRTSVMEGVRLESVADGSEYSLCVAPADKPLLVSTLAKMQLSLWKFVEV